MADEIIKQQLISELRRITASFYKTDDPNAVEKIYLGCNGCPEEYNECTDKSHCRFKRDDKEVLSIHFKFEIYLTAICSVLNVRPRPVIFIDIGSRPGLHPCFYIIILNDTVIFRDYTMTSYWPFSMNINELREHLYNDFCLTKVKCQTVLKQDSK